MELCANCGTFIAKGIVIKKGNKFYCSKKCIKQF